MLIPEGLWQPTTKDLQTAFAPIALLRRFQNSNTATGVSVTSSLAIQGDEAVLLSHISAVSDPGAAQAATFITVNVLEGTAIICNIVEDGITVAPLTAGLPSTRTWQGELILLQGMEVQMTALFDSGVANNFVTLSLGGARIPRGNWQRG